MSPALANVLEKIRRANLPSFIDVQLNGPNVRTRSFGETPLHVVAIWGDVDSARVLIDEGGVIDVPGEEGCTPLHDATMQGHVEFVKLLLERGADRTIRCAFGNFDDIAKASDNPEIRKLARHGGEQSSRA
jgi:ankyrin repeat protein